MANSGLAGYASSNPPAPSAVHSRSETDRTHRAPLAGSRPGTRNQPAASASFSQTLPVPRMTTPKAPLRSSEAAPRYRADYAARTSNHRLQTGTPSPPPANTHLTMVESFSKWERHEDIHEEAVPGFTRTATRAGVRPQFPPLALLGMRAEPPERAGHAFTYFSYALEQPTDRSDGPLQRDDNNSECRYFAKNRLNKRKLFPPHHFQAEISRMILPGYFCNHFDNERRYYGEPWPRERMKVQKTALNVRSTDLSDRG